MKKLIGLSILFGALFLLAGTSDAAGPVKGAKPSVAQAFGTTLVHVSSVPVVLYSVILSTGANGDFTAIFDTATTVGITTTGTSALKTRILTASTTANTVINFDPPLQLKNGLVFGQSSGVDQSLIVYEKGIVVQGY